MSNITSHTVVLSTVHIYTYTVVLGRHLAINDERPASESSPACKSYTVLFPLPQKIHDDTDRR